MILNGHTDSNKNTLKIEVVRQIESRKSKTVAFKSSSDSFLGSFLNQFKKATKAYDTSTQESAGKLQDLQKKCCFTKIYSHLTLWYLTKRKSMNTSFTCQTFIFTQQIQYLADFLHFLHLQIPLGLQIFFCQTRVIKE